ncbi:amidohydrolase [Alteribacillus sp. HJP-4]|uniref:amidohydrolase n=1 Tax=Alteribacillus sp. HJP-4 TaxID=2775394 RepID=UPI0035CCDB8F
MCDPLYYLNLHKDSLLNTYTELHALAEPSWQEKYTSDYIKKKLSAAGYHVRTYAGHYGLTTDLPGKSQKVIALRADMDALLQEKNGKIIANHSCGHDAHSTMVLYTALALIQNRVKLDHTVRFIFQPAEEKAEGASCMKKEGVLENVSFLAGIHLRPAFEVPFQKASPVISHGSTAALRGTIRGLQAHASRPEEGNNPIEAASLLIQALQSIRLKEKGRYSLKITSIQSGESSNIIPETARFNFDLRAETNDIMQRLLTKAKSIILNIAELTESDISFEIEGYSPAAVFNASAVDTASKAIAHVLGEDNVVPDCVSPGAEDFHYYTLDNPGLAATMIGLGCDLKPGLHHPDMSFQPDALLYGAKILSKLMLLADKQALGEESAG